MKKTYPILLMTCAIAFGLVLIAPSGWADQWNKKTIVTINNSMQLPGGTVLQPGKYVFKLMDSPSNRHIVQIFNEDENKVIATILAIPNYRLKPTGESEFGFWEAPSGSPPPLRSWFYPGDNFGQEFAYPKTEATAIARTASNVDVPVITEQDQAQIAEAQAQVEQPGEPPPAQPVETPKVAEQAAVEQPAPVAPPVETQARTEAVQAESRSVETFRTAPATELPRTASPFPLVGLIGLVGLGMAILLRAIRQFS